MLLSYDVERMKQLLRSFYALTQMRIVVFNDQMEKIAEYPEEDCAFCSLVRQNQTAERRCRDSDREACKQCRESGQFYAYQCHAGLTEAVTPIRCGNIITGYIMFGQVLAQEDKEAYWPEVHHRLLEYRIPEADLRAAYEAKPTNRMEQVLASAQILEACAGYLYLQRLISLREDSLPQQLDRYLTTHLQADLSVNALCRRFGISRSRLYQIAREYYGAGVEQTTRRLRVAEARRLLAQSERPVSEIAAMVGYGDYNYFIKVFRKETGITPARYRRQQGGGDRNS